MIKKDYHIQSPNYVDDNEFGRKKNFLLSLEVVLLFSLTLSLSIAVKVNELERKIQTES